MRPGTTELELLPIATGARYREGGGGEFGALLLLAFVVEEGGDVDSG